MKRNQKFSVVMKMYNILIVAVVTLVLLKLIKLCTQNEFILLCVNYGLIFKK